MLVLGYATVKFLRLIKKSNPDISQYREAYHSDFESPINLNAIGFTIAFAFESYFSDEKLLESPEFVKNIARRIIVKDYVRTERIIPFHKCTEADYAEFNPILETQFEALEKRKRGDGLWCLDWDDEDPFLIFGQESDADYARLDFKLAPCNEISTTKETSFSLECNTDKQKQFEYTGETIQLILYHNSERFDT